MLENEKLSSRVEQGTYELQTAEIEQYSISLEEKDPSNGLLN